MKLIFEWVLVIIGIVFTFAYLNTAIACLSGVFTGWVIIKTAIFLSKK